LQEIVHQVFDYLQGNLLASVGIAFVAGLAATKTVAYERRSAFIVFIIVGLIGLFLGQFVLFYFHLNEYLEKISEFRILFDFIAAYVGSFIIAAILHAIKPT
jgi:uncharacterized membrane protein YeaQ/YmgE (transglycosylase-associated protein family)